VRAGLIPALKRSGDASEAMAMRPGRQPLHVLANALIEPTSRITFDHGEGTDDRTRRERHQRVVVGGDPLPVRLRQRRGAGVLEGDASREAPAGPAIAGRAGPEMSHAAIDEGTVEVCSVRPAAVHMKENPPR